MSTAPGDEPALTSSAALLVDSTLRAADDGDGTVTSRVAQGNEQAAVSGNQGEDAALQATHSPPMTQPRHFEDGHFFHSPEFPGPISSPRPQQAESDQSYNVAPSHQLLPPPDFKPFFTLVHDAPTNSHHHPTSVHYIFSDDDPDLLTSAMLEAVHLSEPQEETTATQETQEVEVEERFVIVDMHPDGKTVGSTVSLSPHWQGLKTEVSQAPSWSEGAGTTRERGLMLKISGIEVSSGKQQRGQERQGIRIEDLVMGFNERLDGLDELLGIE